MSKKESKIFLVIPTIRDLVFLKKWKNEFAKVHLIVVEDRDKKEAKITGKFASIHHFDRSDVDRDFGKNSWIVSRFNSGIRSYGFWKAYKMGAGIILNLDDDCYPAEKDFVTKHVANLAFSIPSNWMNTYPDPKWMYTRGVPYGVRNKVHVMLSHGIWSGALDLDAKTEIKLPRLLTEKAYPPIRNIIPFNYYYPMCSMNFAFRREITPIIFFPMMGKNPVGAPWPYDRYDDIWAGIFSKKIMDHLGLGVVSGSPIIEHRKASKVAHNHIKEKDGMVVNERLWKWVDNVTLTAKTPKKCYIELAQKVKFPKTVYFTKLRQAMIIWANLF